MLAFVVCLVFGVIVCITGPAFDEFWQKRQLRLDSPKMKLLAASPCRVCGRLSCPYFK